MSFPLPRFGGGGQGEGAKTGGMMQGISEI